MLSRIERRDERGKTLASLAACEIHPEVYENGGEPASHALHARKSREMLAGSLEDTLYVEDDVDVDVENMRWALEQCGDSVVYFYLPASRYYPAPLRRLVDRGAPVRRGLYPIVAPRRLFGSQAFYLPRWAVEGVVRDGEWRSCPGGFDLVLKDYLSAVGHRPLAAVPNPVQHRSPKGCTPTTRPHFSRSFGLDCCG